MHEQVRPIGFTPWGDSGPGTVIASSAVVEAVGFDLANEWLVPIPHSCEGITREGTLCPNVVYPARTLTESQLARLVALLPLDGRAPTGGDPPTRAKVCAGSPPRNGFIVYAKERRPVAEVVIDACWNWRLRPGPPVSAERWWGRHQPTPRAREALMALCRDVGLTGCDRPLPLTAPDDPEPPALAEERQLRRTRELTALTSALLQDWPDVPPDRRVSATSPAERTLLCGWYARAAGVALSRMRGDGFAPLVDTPLTLQPSGHRVHLRDFEGCLRNFPSCDDAVGVARACVAEQLEALPSPALTCTTACPWGLTVEARARLSR